jgi:hypothetical protein
LVPSRDGAGKAMGLIQFAISVNFFLFLFLVDQIKFW